MKKNAFLIAMALSFTAAAVASANEPGPVAVDVRVDKTEAQVAEPVMLTVTYTADPGIALTLPALEQTLGELAVTDVRDIADLPMGDKRQWVRTIELESYQSGQIIIPQITAIFTDRRFPDDPISGQVTTQPITLAVASVLEGQADPTQFRDIKGLVEAPRAESVAWVWPTVIGGGCAAVLALGALAWSRRKAAVLSADRRALQAIDELIAQQPDVQRLYLRLTAIVRQYIEARFEITAPRLTTPEFLNRTKDSHALTDEDKRSLHAFLTAADLVKFARYQPSSASNEDAVGTARAFIERSARRIANPEPEGAAA